MHWIVRLRVNTDSGYHSAAKTHERSRHYAKDLI